MNKTFVLTGTLSRLRADVVDAIRAAGGRVVGKISNQVDYLVQGIAPGRVTNKAREAAQNGVIVISENDLFRMLRGGASASRSRTATILIANRRPKVVVTRLSVSNGTVLTIISPKKPVVRRAKPKRSPVSPKKRASATTHSPSPSKRRTTAASPYRAR